MLLQDYYSKFIPSNSRYAVKPPRGNKWLSRWGTPSENLILDHLTNAEGNRVACKSKWYPYYAVIDFDDRDVSDIDRVRQKLCMNESNSFLFQSESENSYHLYFKPRYSERENMITARLLHDAAGGYISKNKAELYPHNNRVFRLPAGARSSLPVDPGRESLTEWSDKLYWLDKIDVFDISSLPIQLDLFKQYDRPHNEAKVMSTMEKGKLLLDAGLQSKRSRNESQFFILYYFFRSNESPETAIQKTKNWIRKKHNGLSLDVNRGRWKQIDREIEAQAWQIYDKYTLPDIPHNQFFGALSKNDIIQAAKLSGGNIPRFKFLYNLLRWYRVRMHRTTVRCHRDNFRQWAGGDYLPRLHEFEKSGLLQRGSGYIAGSLSKPIKLKFNFDGQEPILIDGRAGSFTDTLKIAFHGRELFQLLTASGSNYHSALYTIRRLKSE